MKKRYKSLLLGLLLVCLCFGTFSMPVNATSKLKAPTVTVSNDEETGKVKISWRPVKKAVSYKVYRSTDGKNWKRITTTKNTEVLNTKNITAGKKYYYKVRAIASKSANDSEYSSVKQRMCDLPRPAVSIANVESSGAIKLTWNKVKGATGYKIYRSLNKKEWKLLKKVNGTEFTNTTVEVGKKYYYKVQALASNKSANSAYSVMKGRTCDLPRPVVKLSTDKSTQKILVSWSKVKGAVSYKVYNSTDNKNWKSIKTTSKTSVVNTSAKSGKKYYYKVVAIAKNTAANSAASKVKSKTCPSKENSGGSNNTTDTGDLKTYQKEVVKLAKDIANNWKTVYRQGKIGQEVSDGVYAFDCSGFSSYVLNKVMQKRVPTYRLTSSIKKLASLDAVYNGGYPGELCATTIKLKDIQPGDVVFFSCNSKNDHCGIYIGDDKFAHSTRNKNETLISSLSGYYKEHFSMARRYLPTKVEPANTKKTIKSGCYLYSEKGNDNSKSATLKVGDKVTVLYTGNSPASYNQAYVKLSNGKKGFVYTKKFK